MQQLEWLASCMKGKRRWFWLAMSLAVFSSGLCMVFPFITRQITDQVLVGQAQPGGGVVHHTELLPMLIGIMLVAQLIRSGARYTMMMLLEHTSQNVQQQIRHHLYDTLCKQDTAFYGRCRVGDLMTRLTGDLDMVRHTISWISFSVVESSTLFLFSMLYLFRVNAELTGYLLLVSPVILLCAYTFSRTVYPKYVKLREKLSHMNSVAQENIEGNKTVRAFVREEYENEKFGKCNEEFRAANLAANFHWLKFYPVIEGCAQLMGILVVLVGGSFIIRGKMTPGDLAAFSLMAWGLSDPMRALGNYLNDFQRFLTSANKIIEIYYGSTGIENPEIGITAGDTPGTVEFREVSYAYPRSCGQKTLDNISFKLERGQTLALLGSTGSGKTTLIDLVTRMLDTSAGEVLVDGVNVRQWALEALRGRIGVATQKVMLYSDTVAANVAYSDPAMPEEEIPGYLNLAAADFAFTLSDGLDTVIGEQGTGLSGGQKQRIALARALAKKPEILILDDTTSAVDTETERQLRENLRALPYPCTKIIVAQRISSVRDADCILVLEKGKIIQRGRHQELMAQPGYYRDVCEMQGVLLPTAEEVS